jgi:hypothetical protein
MSSPGREKIDPHHTTTHIAPRHNTTTTNFNDTHLAPGTPTGTKMYDYQRATKLFRHFPLFHTFTFLFGGFATPFSVLAEHGYTCT